MSKKDRYSVALASACFLIRSGDGYSQLRPFSRRSIASRDFMVTKRSRHIFVASLTEGLPNVVIETMACGTAIVATTAGGTPDLITDKVTGILTPPGDPLPMTEAIIKLAQDKTMRQNLGKVVQIAFLSDPWTPQTLGDRTIEIYQQAQEMVAC
jgi:glycosyltransferase involved in cell wall biosynthesis